MPSVRGPTRPRATRKLAPRTSNAQASSSRVVENEDERLERERREREREERKRRRRLDALERGTATIEIDSSDIALPSESTYAGTLAGILAGRRAMESEGMVDVDDLDDLEAGSEARKAPIRGAEGVAGKRAAGTKASRRTVASSVKALLSSRKGYNALIETASSDPLMKAPFTYLKAAAPPSRYPDHRAAGRVCQICGTDWVRVKCLRCSEGTCGTKCSATHDETRCDRPV